ncbi:nuclear transport factor 2 family protein [Amycolatopsis alba]|uniref:nuclear transport factor 2 family protein n=1 Tax=Amycolatopsis alba TaxID=76020 RepID=UPI001427B333|nr:nuclear transport factor 2 family protein [Amycolatopsis alba]
MASTAKRARAAHRGSSSGTPISAAASGKSPFASNPRRKLKFQATHHSISGHLVEVEGDVARLRATMTAVHVWAPELRDELSLGSHFTAGSVITGEAVRTGEGRRFRDMELRIVWRDGFMPLDRLIPPSGADQAQ